MCREREILLLMYYSIASKVKSIKTFTHTIFIFLAFNFLSVLRGHSVFSSRHNGQ